MKPEDIAKICHEVNRAYCLATGEGDKPPWDEFDRKASTIAGVKYTLENLDASPEEQHEAWLLGMEQEGWIYGEVQDEEAKEHPCMVPYDDLPEAQKVKDYLFQAVVRTAMTIKEKLEDITLLPVKYIGHRDEYNDGIAGSGVWSKDQTKMLPEKAALKLLAHPTVYVPGEAEEANTTVDLTEEDGKEAEEERLTQARDLVNSMTRKAQIQEYVATQYNGLEIPGEHKTVAEMREFAIRQIDLYGVLK